MRPKERARERSRDAGKDTKEKEKARLGMAYEQDKKITEKERAQMKRAGFSDEQIRERLAGVSRTAGFLLANASDELDKLVAERKKRLEEMRESRQKCMQAERSSSSKLEGLANVAKGFKERIREKKASSESRETSEKKKEPKERTDSKPVEKTRKQSVSDKKKLDSKLESESVLKEVLDGAKELRKNPERERGLKKTKHSIESKTEIQRNSGHLERKNLGISPSVVRDACKKLEPDSIDTKRILKMVEELYLKSDDKRTTIRYANLTEVLPKETTKRIEEIFSQNKEEIEKTLQTRLGIEKSESQLRIASVEGRLYTWTHDQSKNDMLNAWSKQYFYFKDKKAQSTIENCALSNLQLNPNSSESKVHYNKIMDQLFHQGENRAIKKSKHLNETRVQGESLRFQMDSARIKTSFLEGKISKIAGMNGHGGIANPRFPEGMKFQTLRARIIGTAVSDCQIRGGKGLIYSESSSERIKRFQETLSNFGDIRLKENLREGYGVHEIYINSAMSEAVQFWGIPIGDRTILNYGLPKDSSTWSTLAKRALMQDTISQEGCVSSNGEISWNRRHALVAGTKKAEKYAFQSKLSSYAIDFLRTSNKMNRTYESSKVGEIYITPRALEKLQTSQDSMASGAAKEILQVVNEYRNRLIDDETSIVESMGIRVTSEPMQVSYYERSGRVSVRWQARIRDKESMLRSAFLMRPNDAKKSSILDAWLSKQTQEDVKRTKEKLNQEGFEIS